MYVYECVSWSHGKRQACNTYLWSESDAQMAGKGRQPEAKRKPRSLLLLLLPPPAHGASSLRCECTLDRQKNPLCPLHPSNIHLYTNTASSLARRLFSLFPLLHQPATSSSEHTHKKCRTETHLSQFIRTSNWMSFSLVSLCIRKGIIPA